MKTCNVYRSNQPINHDFDFGKNRSIFLAGPSPRDAETRSWRPEAVEILEEIIESIGYDIWVFIPEPFGESYEHQVSWEWWALNNVEAISFWVPRHMPEMAGLTTNVEFGMFLNDERTIYGRPKDAQHCRYLDWHYNRVKKRLPYDDLKSLMKASVAFSILRSI